MNNIMYIHYQATLRRWNTNIKHLLNDDNAALDCLAGLHEVTNDLSSLQQVLVSIHHEATVDNSAIDYGVI